MNIEAGTVGIRVRCAAHNHVFELYSKYTFNGEVVIDLVPCPQCSNVGYEEENICTRCAGFGYMVPTLGNPDCETCDLCKGTGLRHS
jgi:hypothetical protein